MNRNHATTASCVVLLVVCCVLIVGCPCRVCMDGCSDDPQVRLTPFSGRFGYGLEGPYGFVGSLTKNELTDATWHLEGELCFPTAGYTVEEPLIEAAGTIPEHVTVTITVAPPAPGSVVAQAIAHVPVTADIPASNDPVFTILIVNTNCALCQGTMEVALRNPKDEWQLVPGLTESILVITCPSGIGSATVRCSASSPLQQFSVGLRYAPGRPFTRLEGFEAASANGTKWSDPPRRLARHPAFLDVRIPEAAFGEGADTLTIDWVDMYR